MRFSCENCGKTYSINITAQNASPSTISHSAESDAEGHAQGTSNDSGQVEDKKPVRSPVKNRGIRFGLRSKMVLLFVVVPIILMIGASLFFLNQMKELSSLITEESSQIVTKMGEQFIIEKGRSVAREVKLYLETHPDLRPEDFNKDPEFVKIAMQDVGETGYTLLVSRSSETEPEYMWVHPDPNLIGIDITQAMKERLGDKYERWHSIQASDHETYGYYLWFDNREKFCANIPLEGTKLNIVSSTYMDEFSKPVIRLHEQAKNITYNALKAVIIIIIVATMLVGAIALIYGNIVSGNIRRLTDVTERISVGDLSAEISLTSKDELGVLAEAIRRLEDSIRISMERLRRRR